MVIKLISQMKKWGSDEFPAVAVMNNSHTPGFKQHRLHSVTVLGLKPKMGLTRLVTGAVFHLETVRENQFPCSFKASF